MTINILLYYLIFALACATLWYLYFWLYKDFIVDVFRQKVFVMRDSLFDDARNGLIDFNHPAYCTLRRTMNGYIRFSHQTNILNALIFSIILNKKSVDNAPYAFERTFESSLEGLDDDTVLKLRKYKRESRVLLAKLMFLESPIMTLVLMTSLVVTVVPIVLIVCCKNWARGLFKRILLDKIRNMESVAFALGKS